MRLRYLLIGFILGLYAGWIWFRDEESASIQHMPEPISKKTVKQKRDVLSEIVGIGPAYERALNAIGIFTFAQLAVQDAAKLANQLTSARVSEVRIRRGQWIEQASAKLIAVKSDKQPSWIGHDISSKTEGSDSE